jgi:hypothetical protein
MREKEELGVRLVVVANLVLCGRDRSFAESPAVYG